MFKSFLLKHFLKATKLRFEKQYKCGLAMQTKSVQIQKVRISWNVRLNFLLLKNSFHIQCKVIFKSNAKTVTKTFQEIIKF